jgi:hypothetical protein
MHDRIMAEINGNNFYRDNFPTTASGSSPGICTGYYCSMSTKQKPR